MSYTLMGSDRPRVRARNFLLLLTGAALMVGCLLTTNDALKWVTGVGAVLGFVGFFLLGLHDIRKWAAARRS